MRRMFQLLACVSAVTACRDDLAPAPRDQEDISAMVAIAGRIPPRNAHAVGDGISTTSSPIARIDWRSNWDDSTMFARAADSTFILSLKIPGTRRGVWQGRVLVDLKTRAQAVESVRGLARDVQIVRKDSLYPTYIVRVGSVTSLRRLRSLPFVDYVEPDVVRGELTLPMTAGGAGCGINPVGDTGLISSQFGDVMSPSYVRANIPQAWTLSQGENVSLGLADAVISPQNPELFSNPQFGVSGFASGNSSTRWLQQTDPPEGEVCSHAERMAMVMAGPANGQGNVGVAWKANLRSGAALSEVNIQFGPPMSQIARGVRFAANQYSVLPKVVAMAFGQISGSDLLSDVIQDLTWNFDVVFIGAAGTDIPPEVGGDGAIAFPASLPWVLAVTSANASGNPDPGTSNHPLARLSALRDNIVGPMMFTGVHPTLGYCENCLVPHSTFSGSSAATAVISGVAALVRSRFRWMSNEQVRDQLVLRSSQQGGYPFPRPHVDALAALGSFCGRMLDFDANVYVDFESTSDPARVLQVSGINTCGGYQAPMSYLWNASTDEAPMPQFSSGSSVTVTIYPPASISNQYIESGSIFATITDPALGSYVQRHVRIYRRATQCVAAGECP